MKINNILNNNKTNSFSFFDENYLVLLESFRTYFNNNLITQEVPPLYMEKYKGDFYGLLSYYKIDMNFHYIIMRVNNITSSDNFNEKNSSIILLPDVDFINSLHQVYTSSRLF